MPSETPAPRKAGARREAALNHPLDGRGTPRMSLAESRALARAAYERLPLPSWRRSGFWATSLRGARDRRARGTRARARPVPTGDPRRRAGGRGARAARLLGRSRRARRRAGRARSDPLQLEDAAQEHTALFERYYLRRLPVDRHKLEAASAAFWSGGAFLYVPPELRSTTRSRSSTRSAKAGPRNTPTRSRSATAAARSACANTASPARRRASRCTPANSSSISRTTRAAG